jgi:glycerophosphoryl diester phosphodiesterase
MKRVVLVLLALVLSAGIASAQVCEHQKTLKIGHRGARALVDENTMESLMKGVELGVDSVEFDIQRTKDGVFVLMHDPKVDRTTDGKGLVSSMTLAEVKKLKTKSGYTLPTLEEVLAALKPTKVGIILDIKLNDPKSIPDVYALVEKYGLVERTVFETSSPKVAKAIEKFNPELVSAIYPVLQFLANFYAEKYNIDIISLNYNFANPHEIKMAHKNNRKIVVWTVDDAAKIVKFQKAKVDGIMTDDPNLFSKGCGCGK